MKQESSFTNINIFFQYKNLKKLYKSKCPCYSTYIKSQTGNQTSTLLVKIATQQNSYTSSFVAMSKNNRFAGHITSSNWSQVNWSTDMQFSDRQIKLIGQLCEDNELLFQTNIHEARSRYLSHTSRLIECIMLSLSWHVRCSI